MKTNHVVRAWKNQEYRQNLSEAEQAQLPAHPSGMIELTDADLGVVSGGVLTAGPDWVILTHTVNKLICCYAGRPQ